MLNPETYFQDWERIWRYLVKKGDMDVKGLCEKRGYLNEEMGTVLQEAGLVWVSGESVDLGVMKTVENYGELGLEMFTRVKGETVRSGRFLLEDRYVLPIRSVEGKIYALVGWYPDVKKYITTPSTLFSKSHLFYGMEQLKGRDLKKTTLVLVEGIFDSLSLRSLGVEDVVVLATMGANVDGIKQELYRLFKRVIAIPDRDTVGRKTVKNDLWSLPLGSCYLQIVANKGEEGIEIKDIDDVVKLCDSQGLKDYLTELVNATTLPRVVKMVV